MTLPNHSQGLWVQAWQRLKRDRVAMIALSVVLAYLLVVILAALGLIAPHWDREVGVNYAPPTWVGAELQQSLPGGVSRSAADGPADLYGLNDPLAPVLERIHVLHPEDDQPSLAEQRLATLPLGGDKWGHDILAKVVKGTQTSLLVGLISALVATLMGTVLGAVSGYFGRRVDDFLNWVYGVFTAIPYLLLVFAIAAVLQQKGVTTIILILGLTGWTGVYRLVRAEYLKHKSREYVLAASAIGASHWRRMFVHILPNVSHVVLVQLSVNVVGFIKSEVILSFLGFGVPVDVVSWGSMLNEAQNELVLGKWWQLVAATLAMAVLVTAFSMLTDALRDALDPRLKNVS